jgi:hypothetical protein
MHENERDERRPVDDEALEDVDVDEQDNDAGSAASLVAHDVEEWWRR